MMSRIVPSDNRIVLRDTKAGLPVSNSVFVSDQGNRTAYESNVLESEDILRTHSGNHLEGPTRLGRITFRLMGYFLGHGNIHDIDLFKIGQRLCFRDYGLKVRLK